MHVYKSSKQGVLYTTSPINGSLGVRHSCCFLDFHHAWGTIHGAQGAGGGNCIELLQLPCLATALQSFSGLPIMDPFSL